MKKSLLSILAVACLFSVKAQVFSTSFESWTSNDPDGFLTSGATSFNTDSVVQVTGSSTYGNSAAQLINSTSSHKRLTTSALSITAGQTYQIEYWVKGQGDIRAGLFDGGTGVGAYAYATYNTVSTSSWTQYTQTITADTTSATAGFILSAKATVGSAHLQVDSFVVTAVSTPSYSIYQLQNTTLPSGDSPYNNQTVMTGGIVTAVDASAYWVQSGTGPWTGVYVFDATNAPTVAIGDSVTFSALVTEYFNLTELKNVSSFTKVSSGNTLPAISMISTADANLEEYEGVLVRVSSASCTAANGAGNQWTVNDGSGAVFIDDEIYAYTASAGTVYQVTGPAHYSFSERKIEPRMASDVVITTGIENTAAATSVKVYPNPSNGAVTIANANAGDVVHVYDLNGKLISSVKAAVNGNLTLELENNGVYFVQLSNAHGIRTAKVVVNK